MALTPSRTELAATWTASTLIAYKGEVLLASDTGVYKIGDGINKQSKLPIADIQPVVVPVSSLVSATLYTVTDAITASATQTQAGATGLTADGNRVVTVVSANDAVRLPKAVAGLVVTVKNAHATNAIGVFPASGDAVNTLSANGVYALAATKMAEFNCIKTGVWDAILSA